MTFPGERGFRPDVIVSQSKEYFLSHPPTRPKSEVAEYVESCKILVPRRFGGLDDALSSGKPFVVRSEHSQDYAGVSGLLESYHITTERIARERVIMGGVPRQIDWYSGKGAPEMVETQIIAQLGHVDQDQFEKNLTDLSQENIDKYIALTGEDFLQFYNGISYSYWERLDGINRSVVADSTIPGQYHIFSKGWDTTFGYPKGRGYALVQDEKIVTEASENLEGSAVGIAQSVDMYSTVRNLDRFDNNHCPIVEIQSVGEQPYFLQYHRATDFQPATHVLDREKKADEIETIFVRGATPPEGIEANMHVYYGGFNYPLQREDGALELQVNPVYTEHMVRQRQLQVVAAYDREDVGLSTDGGHLAVSQLFKPGISIAVDRAGQSTLLDGVERSKKDNLGRLTVRVISDGKKAYIEKLK